MIGQFRFKYCTRILFYLGCQAVLVASVLVGEEDSQSKQTIPLLQNRLSGYLKKKMGSINLIQVLMFMQ